MKSSTITTNDNKKIKTYSWKTGKTKISANIFIVHGMAEHAKRYHDFALFLNKKKINVYSFDLRGHGSSIDKGEHAGIYSENGIWDRFLNDIIQYIDRIHTRNPKIPLFILGHSLGSSLVRDLIIRTQKYIHGCICIGISASPGIMGIFGLIIACIHRIFTGGKARSILFNNLLFGAFNKTVTSPKTDFDWLSRNEIEVNKYINDPLCGFVYSLSYYIELIKSVFMINSRLRIRRIKKDLPLFLICGDKDPVSGMGKGIHKVYHLYKKAGLKKIEMTLLKDFRHEILNEIGKDVVYSLLYEWIEKTI